MILVLHKNQFFSQKSEIAWSTAPITVSDFDSGIEPTFRINIARLVDDYVQDNMLVVRCSFIIINEDSLSQMNNPVCIFSFPSVLDPCTKPGRKTSSVRAGRIDGFEDSYSYSRRASTISQAQVNGLVFTEVVCGGCGETPLKLVCYKCLECNDFYLCQVCFDNEAHILHVFAVLKFQEQQKTMKELT